MKYQIFIVRPPRWWLHPIRWWQYRHACREAKKWRLVWKPARIIWNPKFFPEQAEAEQKRHEQELLG